jgi:hypothetical protein
MKEDQQQLDLLTILSKLIHIERMILVDGTEELSFTLKAGGSSISLMANGDIHIKAARNLVMDSSLTFDNCDPSFIEDCTLHKQEGTLDQYLDQLSMQEQADSILRGDQSCSV